jgi:hypothetical protein
MYSFLFLNAEQFKAAEENEILDTMPGAFSDNLPIKQLVGGGNRSTNTRKKSSYHFKHEFRRPLKLSENVTLTAQRKRHPSSNQVIEKFHVEGRNLGVPKYPR